jgi:hypothetical protein
MASDEELESAVEGIDTDKLLMVMMLVIPGKHSKPRVAARSMNSKGLTNWPMRKECTS